MFLEKIKNLQKFENDQIEDVLKETGKDILYKYNLCINGDENNYLIPFWIEAYCFIKGKFEDKPCDGSNRNNGQYSGKEEHWVRTFSNLHFAYLPSDEKSNWWKRCRADFVPKHDETFALSYLLKVCIHCEKDKEPKLLIQSEIVKLLKDQVSLTLISKENEIDDSNVSFSRGSRVGIPNDEYQLSFNLGDVFNEINYDRIRKRRKTLNEESKGDLNELSKKALLELSKK